jgi:hypothetical protein
VLQLNLCFFAENLSNTGNTDAQETKKKGQAKDNSAEEAMDIDIS